MDAQELDQLVAAIGEEILARSAGAPKWTSQECQCAPQTCAGQTKEILAAGAERVSACARHAGVDAAIASFIDHTLLRPEATAADIRKCARKRGSTASPACA